MSEKNNSVTPQEDSTVAASAKDDGTGGQLPARGNWGGQIEFLLTMIGFAVGLGNVWRFPYQCFKNGGGAFVIAYFIMLFLLGIPVFFFELAFGQFASLGPTAVWIISPLFKGVGYCCVAATWVVALYYNVIIAWCIYFFFASMTSHLPWAFCDQTWNTQACVTTQELAAMRMNDTILNQTLIDRGLGSIRDFKTPSEEYFYNQVLDQSAGMHEAGRLVWPLALCLLLSWIIIFFVLIKGVNSLGKVMYFFTIFPYIMLFCFLIQNARLPGAREGVIHYLKPNWQKLREAGVWSDAATQIFYNLSACTGGLIALASYNKFKNNCLRDSLIVPLINAFTSLLAGFVVFTCLGYMAYQKNMLDDFDSVVKGGPGLTFVVYPEAIVQMQGSTAWAVLFFLMMICLGFSSQFSIVESIFVAVMDEFPALRRDRKTTIIFRGVSIAIFYIISLPMVTQCGYYLFNLLDTMISGFPLLFVGLIELIAVFWVYGFSRFLDDIHMMIGVRLPQLGYFLACWVVITPILLVAIIVFKGIEQKPLELEGYLYPGWARAIGWLVVAFSLSWFPIVLVVQLVRYKGDIKKCVSPTPEWGPALPEDRTGRYAPKEELSGYANNGMVLTENPPPYILSDKPADVMVAQETGQEPGNASSYM